MSLLSIVSADIAGIFQELGEPAVYTPPIGNSIAVNVIVDRELTDQADANESAAKGRRVAISFVSGAITPERGGLFALDSTGETFYVDITDIYSGLHSACLCRPLITTGIVYWGKGSATITDPTALATSAQRAGHYGTYGYVTSVSTEYLWLAFPVVFGAYTGSFRDSTTAFEIPFESVQLIAGYYCYRSTYATAGDAKVRTY